MEILFHFIIKMLNGADTFFSDRLIYLIYYFLVAAYFAKALFRYIKHYSNNAIDDETARIYSYAILFVVFMLTLFL